MTIYLTWIEATPVQTVSPQLLLVLNQFQFIPCWHDSKLEPHKLWLNLNGDVPSGLKFLQESALIYTKKRGGALSLLSPQLLVFLLEF